jgi:flavin reductase (DIM6/NTAB) family NADH-FMN oxidoreductase RutF
MIFETSNLDANEIYRLLVGGITPRPIAWISTLSVDGVANIAPYSFFNVASCNPRSSGIHKSTQNMGKIKIP